MFQNRLRSYSKLLQFSIALILIWVISNHFRGAEMDHLVEEFGKSLTFEGFIYLFLAVILMPLNWSMEALKWRSVSRDIGTISFYNAFNGVVLGVSISLVTPMRIGDYLGRLKYISSTNYAAGVKANFISSLSQNIVNTVFGMIAFVLFISSHGISFGLSNKLNIGLGIVLILLSLYYYFNAERLERLFPFSILKGIFFPAIMKNLSRVVIDRHKKFALLLYSVIRYVIYTLQYFLIIRATGIEGNYMDILTGVSVIYLIQTLIPLPAILGFIARAEVAILVWGSFAYNEIAVLAASYGLWVINQLLVSIPGIYILLKGDVGSVLEEAVSDQ